MTITATHFVITLSGRRESIMPGDNPLYMSAADLRGEKLSSVHNSPSHTTVDGHTPLHHMTTPSPPPLAPPPDLVVDLVTEEMEEGENTCSSTNTHSTTRGNLDPYGNYGDNTITKVAGKAPPSPLFDDSKYIEWSGHHPDSHDSDDVDTDCQSEYL